MLFDEWEIEQEKKVIAGLIRNIKNLISQTTTSRTIFPWFSSSENEIKSSVSELKFLLDDLTNQFDRVMNKLKEQQAEYRQLRKSSQNLLNDIKELTQQKTEKIQMLAFGDLSVLSYAELVELSNQIEDQKQTMRNQKCCQTTGDADACQVDQHTYTADNAIFANINTTEKDE